jgi:MFS family permease
MPPSRSGSADDPRSPAGRPRRLLPDPAPLRAGPDFARLTAAGFVSAFGSVFTLVAIPLQVAQLTRSPLAVGLIGSAELVPTVLGALYGGALADARDRRRVLLGAELALGVLSLVLLANAVTAHRVWPLFVVSALVAAVAGVQQPSRDAAVPRLVPAEQLPSALAWTGLGSGVVYLAGPVLAGLVVTGVGVPAAYLVDLGSAVLAVALLTGLAALPSPAGVDARVRAADIAEGLRYGVRHRLLVGTYLTDLAVTVLAFPIPLYPFLVARLHAPWSLGALYAATGAGALLGSVTSGWTARTGRRGRVALAASATMGLCLVAVGLSGSVWLVLALLVLGGAAHGVGDIMRTATWGQVVPDRMRGRVAGLELLVGAGGPALGDLRAGALGSRIGLGPAIWSGGLACLAVTALVGAGGTLWRYDAADPPDG